MPRAGSRYGGACCGDAPGGLAPRVDSLPRPIAHARALRLTPPPTEPPTHPPTHPRAGHYNGRTDQLRISADWHEDAALNKREALEQLVGLVTAAQGLVAAHGPMRPKPRFPKYSY